MSALTKKEKIEKILELCDLHNITAYNIGINTNLTEAGIGRILAGTVKNPHQNTVNEIYKYVSTFDTFKEDIPNLPKPELKHHHIKLLKDVNSLLAKYEAISNPDLPALKTIKEALQLKKEIQQELDLLEGLE